MTVSIMMIGTERSPFDAILVMLNRCITSLLCCCLIFLIYAETARAKKAVAAKQYIYSRSTTSATSTLLGVSAVPAYVVLPDGSRRGIYITQIMTAGLWRDMGLRPGMLLLSIGNRTIESARSADEIIGKNQGSSFDYTYAKMQGGLPVASHGHYVPFGGGSTGGISPDGNYYPPPEAAKKLGPESSIAELESYMVDLLNQDRAKNGHLPPVKQNPALGQLARNYAEYMIKHGNFSHTDPDGRTPQDRAKQAGLSIGVNENLAFQTRGLQADKKLVEAAEAQMMNEPPNQMNHRGNILHPARQFVGVGVARNAGVLMMVQELADQSP